MTLQDNDQFVVDRGNTPYSVDSQTLVAKLEDSDLMLVCRSGNPYKVTGAEVKDSLGGGGSSINPGINDITLDPATPGSGTEADPYILQTQTVAPYGSTAQSVETITIIGQPPEASVVWRDNSVDAGNRFAQVSGELTDASGVWTGKLEYADIPDSTEDTSYLGKLNVGLVYFQWTVTQKEVSSTPPALTNVSLVESSPAEGARFTSQSFVASSQVTEGEPLSEKTFDAHVDGTLSKTVKFDEPLVSSATDSSGAWDLSTVEFTSRQTSLAYGNGIWVAVSSTTSHTSTDDGATWQQSSEDNKFTEVAYGNGLFVAVGNVEGQSNKYSEARVSVDGMTWTTTTLKSNFFKAITYGNGKFVAVGSGGGEDNDTVAYSTDGETWTYKNPPNNYSWKSVAYGNGRFVAIAEVTEDGSDQDLIYSTNDGFSWDPASTGLSTTKNQYWQDIIFGDNKFVAVRSDNNQNLPIIWTSDSEGTTWTPSNEIPNPSYTWKSLGYLNGLYLAGASSDYNDNILWSLDGVTWSSTVHPSIPVTNDINCILGANNLFMAAGYGAMTSTNGMGAFTALTFAADADTEGVAAGDTLTQNSNFTAPLESSGIDSSGEWTAASAAENNYWRSVTYGNDKFVAVANGGPGGTGGRVMYSPDGITWTSASAATPSYWYAVTYGNGKFVAIANTGTNQVMYSADGINWTSASAAASTEANGWQSITYGGGKFVAVSFSGTYQVMYSPDGINWTAATAATNNTLASVTYGDGKFVAVGDKSIMYSRDGITWTVAASPEANSWNSVTYGNGKFVAIAGSGTNQVMHSPDAINWTAATAAEANNWSSVAYGDGKFVAVANGGTNPVMYSADGIDWTSVSAPTPSYWYSVTYGNGKFVAVANSGTGDRVMYSTNGMGTVDALTFASSTDMEAVAIGDGVNQGSTIGTVGSITGTTATLSSSSGTWVDGLDVTTGDKPQASGTVSGVNTPNVLLSSSSGAWLDGNNVVGPQKTIVVENTRLYCAFDTDGNITDLQNNPQDPPYTTTDTNPGLTFTFPATFPSGETPDDELTDGTTFTVDVTAENSSGTSGPVSATVQPEPGVPPSPVAGLTTLYTGNGLVVGQSVTTGIDLVNNDGLVWIKNRSGDYWHVLTDTLRGAPGSLSSNSGNGEYDRTNGLTSFSENGFSVGSSNEINSDGDDIVAWTFAKAEKYFDVVKYVGTTEEAAGSAGSQTLSHSLGTKPGLMLVKKISASGYWCVYHSSLGADNYSYLNENLGGIAPSQKFWNNTEPTDTQFTVGWDSDVNKTGEEFIAYLFAEDAPGLIKCGGYNGPVPGNVQPVTISLGFKPQWVMIKDTSTGGDFSNWIIIDGKRKTEIQSNSLGANSSESESFANLQGDQNLVEFTEDGMIIDPGAVGPSNVNGVSSPVNKYIYIAIAAPPDARSQTNEEFVESQAKFLTYDNRKQIKQGEEALDDRDALIKQAADLGLDVSQIKKLIGK